jgi:hypothetical protein
LRPNAFESFVLPGGKVDIPKACPTFPPWEGDLPGDTYGGKAVLEHAGEPAFAELVILRTFEADGWEGAWIDTYRNKLRKRYWNAQPMAFLPSGPATLLAKILAHRGTGRSGTWDVFCWRGDDVIFAESKRKGKDAIRESQVTWLEAALATGLTASNFLVVEWSLGSRSSIT